MKKSIAVVVRERQDEALRMAVGLTFLDAVVQVFVMDRPLADDGSLDASLEAIRELGVPLYTNLPGQAGEFRSTEEIARLLAGYRTVLPY